MSRSHAKLAINRFRERRNLDQESVTRFLERYGSPIVESSLTTFLHRGQADGVSVRHRVVGLPDPLPMRRVEGTDLWFVVVDLPSGSRIEYQLEVSIEGRHDRFNDPFNPRLAHNPFGASSVCYAAGYQVPDWARPDEESRPGELVEMSVRSRALRRDCRVTLYLPARFRRTASYPLLVVYDGGDFLQYAAAKTVLDNLIHRLDVAEVVGAFLHPHDRLVEYANSPTYARFVTRELVPRLEAELPLHGRRAGRCLLGSSFGAVAALSTAYRAPDVYGALVLMSGSFVFTDIAGADHGGGPVFDPVVRFVNRYRERPRRVADRMFVSCGMYEPLITPNRSMVPVFESAGMTVRFLETRDGHCWENWRDSLREALSWVYPGPQKLVYE